MPSHSSKRTPIKLENTSAISTPTKKRKRSTRGTSDQKISTQRQKMPPIAPPAQESWTQRETHRQTQLHSNQRHPSEVRISHTTLAGACVPEDYNALHGHAALAAVEQGKVGFYAYPNENGIFTTKGEWTDHQGRKYPYEFEVVFAGEVLGTVWGWLLGQRDRLRGGKEAVVKGLLERYTGIEKEDIEYIYALWKHAERERKERERKVKQLERERKASDRANQENLQQAKNAAVSAATKQAGNSMMRYVEEEAMFCVKGRVVEERCDMSEREPGDWEKREVERCLAEWEALAKDVVGMARELAKVQRSRPVAD